jgi:hypothetical protein
MLRLPLAAVWAAVEPVIQRRGGFDARISHPGVGACARLEELSDAERRPLFKTNYRGEVPPRITRFMIA